MPERGGVQRGAVGIKGVNAVVFRGDENDVMHAALRHGEILHVERLSIDLAVHRIAEDFAKGPRIHVRRGQDCLLQVLTGVLVVVMTSQNVYRSGWHLSEGERGEQNEGKGQRTAHRNLQTILRFPGGREPGDWVCQRNRQGSKHIIGGDFGNVKKAAPYGPFVPYDGTGGPFRALSCCE